MAPTQALPASGLKPKEFKTLAEAVAAIGDRRRIDYLPTIDGQKDPCSRSAYVASEFEYALIQRGFNPARGDSVQVWLP